MAEVGVACSMSVSRKFTCPDIQAAGIAACLGAEPAVILQAAEIGIEWVIVSYEAETRHNLGLTCDPLGGLVQVPCIERNSLGGE
jgi:L-serine deaminase